MHSPSLSRLLSAAVAWGCMAACGGGAEEPLPGSAASLDRLGQAVVRGFVERDTARLNALRLSETEFRDVLWPRLPPSGITYELSRYDTEMRNTRAYRRYLARMGALPLRAVGTACEGASERYDGLELLRDCWVTIRNDSTGAEARMQFFRSAVVRGGGFKIIRYDD